MQIQGFHLMVTIYIHTKRLYNRMYKIHLNENMKVEVVHLIYL